MIRALLRVLRRRASSATATTAAVARATTTVRRGETIPRRDPVRAGVARERDAFAASA